MNHLLNLARLRNRYFIMRHGNSLANQQGIIVSQAENGVDGYGLSELGKSQVSDSVKLHPELDANCFIVSSHFKRATESAEIAHDLLGCVADVQIELRLRERSFGDLELGSDAHYTHVWEADANNSHNKMDAVESPNLVMRRVTAVIAEFETRATGLSILLVSHGDALQVLQTAFAKQEASTHRSIEHLETAEIRHLELINL